MKFLLIILLFCSSSYSQSEEKIPSNIQKKIDKAIDFYKLSLFEDSKKILIDLLYSDEGEKYEPEIRYHLGLASYYEGSTSAAINQWEILGKKYPSSSRNKEINRIYNIFKDESESNEYQDSESFEFNQEIKYSKYFWEPKRPDQKLIFGELIDPNRAVEYYKKLYDKYDDPKKKFFIANHLFYLFAGFNHNGFGYNNFDSNSKKTSGTSNNLKAYSNQQFLDLAILQLYEMESNIIDEYDKNYNYLIEANYVLAVRLSGSDFWDQNVIVNKDSEIFFAKVVSLTNNKQNNIFRTFALLWLGEKISKYIVDEDVYNRWEGKGLTKDEMIYFSNNNIPEDLWENVKLKKININKPFQEAFLINLKIESLLKNNNFLKKYSQEDLQNDISEIKNGSIIYSSANFNSIKDRPNLLNIYLTLFNDCNDLECLNKYSSNIYGKIKLQFEKQRNNRAKTNELYKIRSSLSISNYLLIKKNDISINALAKLLYDNSSKITD